MTRHTIERMARARAQASVNKAVRTALQYYAHQQLVVDAYARGIRRFFLAWHRRAGKDVFTMDFTRERMFERIGSYWHLFPFHTQARRAIWKGIDARTGQRFIDRAFPASIRDSVNDTDMSITLKNGSTWQMLGSDNYDRMVGANPCGIAFSEWALCDPAAWEYIRPILVENRGWAAFITTFRGRNHAYRMYDTVRTLEDWYADLETIENTQRHDGTPIVTQADLNAERKAGMTESMIQQEFYCNPDAATDGAVFSRQHTLLAAHAPIVLPAPNRIARVAWGTVDEGIAATVFQGNHIFGVHTFVESNLADAVQAIAMRHPEQQLVHHAIEPDPMLFSRLDGVGVVPSKISRDQASIYGHAAAMLNACTATALSKDKLLDMTLNFAPYRDRQDDYDLSLDALTQSIAVMHGAQGMLKQKKPINYAAYDRGVI